VSPQDRLTTARNRLATLPNVIRTRREDAIRAERSVVDFDRRLEAAALKVEKAIAELEKTVA
jgi:hypothetical protein